MVSFSPPCWIQSRPDSHLQELRVIPEGNVVTSGSCWTSHQTCHFQGPDSLGMLAVNSGKLGRELESAEAAPSWRSHREEQGYLHLSLIQACLKEAQV